MRKNGGIKISLTNLIGKGKYFGISVGVAGSLAACSRRTEVETTFECDGQQVEVMHDDRAFDFENRWLELENGSVIYEGELICNSQYKITLIDRDVIITDYHSEAEQNNE